MLGSRRRWLLPILVGLAIGLPIIVGSVGSAVAERPDGTLASVEAALTDGPLNVVPLDASVVSYDPRIGGPAIALSGVDEPTHPSQDPVVLAEEKFEGETFPPDGWELFDLAADNDMVPPRYQPAIETCSRQAFVGGKQAVWILGGGSEGSQLGCLVAYPEGAKIQTVLGYKVDLSEYPNGFQMTFTMNLDQPFTNSFLFGAIDLDTGEELFRAFTTLLSTGGQWMPMSEPVPYPDFAGRENILVAFAYRDPLPTGGAGTGVNFGLAIDNIKIEGMPYVGPTDTPTPSITPTPRVSPTPTFTPVPPRKYIYLPLVFREFPVESLPRPEAPSGSGVEVRFGTSVDAETGAIENPGTEFPAGTEQLCTRIRYWGQSPGADLRWQWYMNGNQINFAGLNDTVSLTEAAGFEYRCVGQPPAATYEVRAYIDEAADPAGTGSATVLGGQ